MTPAFEAAILHCLQKAADDRPATGELLAQELVTLLPQTLETSAYRTRITGSEPTVIVRSDAHTAIDPPAEKTGRGAAWLIGAGLVAAFAVAVALPVFTKSRDAESALPPTKQPDSITAVVPTPPITPGLPATPIDTTTRRDSAPRPVRTVGSLVVEVPDNATVSVEGQEPAIGGWRSDSLKPKTYQISAVVPAPPGCPTATASQAAVVRATTRVTRVRLWPRSCGTLVFSSTAREARWALESLTPDDNRARREGAIPATVLLPVGEYYRAISKSKCSPYIDTVKVQANRADTLPRRNPFCP